MSLLYENKAQFIEFRISGGLTCDMHLHNHVELAIILDGSTCGYADGVGGKVQAGNAFIAFPNQVHYFENDQNMSGALLIFPPDIIPAFTPIFKNKVPKSPIIPLDLERISQIFDLIACEENKKGTFSQQIIAGCLQIILAKMFENTELMDTDYKDLSTVKSILIYCNQHFDGNITLDDVADNVHINKYYVSHIFNKEIGISFTDFINSLRVHRAMGLIKDGNFNITEIAFQVGFNSLRSFNRHFLAQSGMTPREYKKAYYQNKQ